MGKGTATVQQRAGHRLHPKFCCAGRRGYLGRSYPAEWADFKAVHGAVARQRPSHSPAEVAGFKPLIRRYGCATATAAPWRSVRAERRERFTHTFILSLFEFPGCIKHFAAVGRGNRALGGIQVKRAFV